MDHEASSLAWCDSCRVRIPNGSNCDCGDVALHDEHRERAETPRQAGLTRAAKNFFKICARCRKEKFHRVRSDKRRPQPYCPECMVEYLKEYRKKNWQRTKARNVWKGMLARCYDKKQGKHCKPGIPKYADYGARGVRVCEAWEDFEAFWNDMGPPPTKLATLDRCNPERNYTPRNCRWVDGEIQSRNRRTTRWITAVDPECGERLILCVTQWSQRMGIARTTIHSRLKRGWNPSRAVTELVQKHTLDDTVPF